MEHYKSWLGLSNQLKNLLCDSLKYRITYFLTRYHDVHNSYGRAAILLDGKELVNFSWKEMNNQEADISAVYKERKLPYNEIIAEMKPKWDADCTYSEMDFLSAALKFRSMSIKSALVSDNYIIKILAIMDKRVGRRTLRRINHSEDYNTYPEWVKQFFLLRYNTDN